MKRIKFLRLSFTLFALLVVLRLFFLQVVRHDYYSALAEGQHWLRREIPALRGQIYSADGFALATNKDAYLVYAIPPEVGNAKETAVKLAKILIEGATGGQVDQVSKGKTSAEVAAPKEGSAGLDLELSGENQIKQEAGRIQKLLELEDRQWVPLAHKVEARVVDQISQLKLPGIYSDLEEKRVYPEGSLAAHVLGFVGKNNQGKDQGYYGLEGFYNRELAGRPGFATLEKDASGKPIPLGEVKLTKAQNGRDLYLTLERGLQYLVEKRLAEGVDKYQAENGTVIILEPQTGKILALANYPTFEPENWTRFLSGESDVSKVQIFRNIAIQDSYEPGSVFKALTVSSALQERVITPETVYNDTGPKEYSGHLIHTWDDKYHGKIDIARILQLSNNTGAAWIGTQLGFDKFAKYLRKYHVGQVLGVDLQGEEAGIVRKRSEWRDIDLANMSFGQGVSVTPLQLVSIVATIANNGRLMRPYIVEKMVEPGLSEKGKGQKAVPREVLVKPELIGQPISVGTARIMQGLLRSVVERGEFKWFVKNAKLSKFSIAGKTGTAQIPEGGRYTNKTQVTFVGFAPVENPRFVMLVKLTHPTTSSYSAETAVPLWLEIAKGVLLHFGVLPEK